LILLPEALLADLNAAAAFDAGFAVATLPARKAWLAGSSASVFGLLASAAVADFAAGQVFAATFLTAAAFFAAGCCTAAGFTG